MAEYGEWNKKGASLSNVTAESEYQIERDFIIKGINEGKLEFREGSVWGNPYFKILRSQLEPYIISELGLEYLMKVKNEAELKVVKKEISATKKNLNLLEIRKKELEAALSK
jgi:hypothetical protein